MRTAARLSLCFALWLAVALATSRFASGPHCPNASLGASAFDTPHRCAS